MSDITASRDAAKAIDRLTAFLDTFRGAVVIDLLQQSTQVAADLKAVIAEAHRRADAIIAEARSNASVIENHALGKLAQAVKDQAKTG